MLPVALFAHGSGGQNRAGDSAASKLKPDMNCPRVAHVQAAEVSTGVWRFAFTVRHNDEGWDHYTDAWQVIDPRSGKVLGDLSQKPGEGHQVQHSR
jgi:hypothetical protein